MNRINGKGIMDEGILNAWLQGLSDVDVTENAKGQKEKK